MGLTQAGKTADRQTGKQTCRQVVRQAERYIGRYNKGRKYRYMQCQARRKTYMEMIETSFKQEQEGTHTSKTNRHRGRETDKMAVTQIDIQLERQ